MSDPNAPSPNLSEDDVRAMVRLVGDVAGVAGDLTVKRRTLANGLADLIDADRWIWSIFRRCEPDGNYMTMNWIHNFPEQDIARIAAAATDTKNPQPENAHVAAMQEAGQHFTRRRAQMVEDGPWYDDPHTKTYRQGWIDDCIFSIYPVEPETGVWSGIGLHRLWGRPAFSPRDARIAHIIAAEVAWLHHEAVPQDRGDGTQHLAPRLRPVLVMLMVGRTRKSIAHDLGLSIHTVGDYIKDIYTHFGVSGRVDLMHRFMSGDGGDVG